MGGIAVDFDVEDVPSASKFVVRSFDLRFLTRRTVVVDGDMVGVGVVDFIGNAGDYAERFTVLGGEFTRKAFGGSSENGEIVVVSFGEFVSTASHVRDDAKAEFLRVIGFAMVLAGKRDEALSETDKSNAESALVDDRFDSVVRL